MGNGASTALVQDALVPPPFGPSAHRPSISSGKSRARGSIGSLNNYPSPFQLKHPLLQRIQSQDQVPIRQPQELQNNSQRPGTNRTENQYKLLHYDNFEIIKSMAFSSQASIFIGKLKDYENIFEKDKKYVVGKNLILKQFNMRQEKSGFKKELKILKNIKTLDLENNGGFPVVISAKMSNSIAEILMSYVGKDIFEIFNLQDSLEDYQNHQCLDLKNIS